MKTFEQFIREQKEYIVSLLDVENVIKNVFDDTKVSSVSTLYEKDEKKGELKLILTINNLFFEKTDILHTKFVFLVDDDKTKLLKNKFYYLYDINCDYKEVKFDDINDLENKLNEIINDRDFGQDIKDLSDINVTISGDVNEWLKENDVVDISIYSITYTPIVDNMPCESLSFKFEINVDDERVIELRLRKIKENDYKFTFKEGEWFHDVTVTDVKAMVQTIGETLKNHIK
jgi:hypothetical protein